VPTSPEEVSDLAARLNARFGFDVTAHAPLQAGVLIHQLDGLEDSARMFSPCAAQSHSSNCHAPRTAARSQRTSSSMIYAGLRQKDSVIPTFSLDGGVVLRPSETNLLCAYGIDGSIDDNKPLSCDHVDAERCVPGCGAPPDWCSKANAHDEGAWLTCGLNWGRSGVRPWRPSEIAGAGGLLDHFALEGAPFTGIGTFKGYNEFVVDTHAWIEKLPASVEAMFLLDCHDYDSNLHYGAADGRGTAANCHEAHENAREMHRTFLETYGLNAKQFPLLKLRPNDWQTPFVEA